MSGRSMEIVCVACGQEALVVRQPVYEGFKKTGEVFVCASCGYRCETESDVPFKRASEEPKIFTEADRPEQIAVFEDNEHQRLCRYCAHYVVNPFTQWCGVHHKEVAATDTCERFEQKSNSPDPL